VSHPDDARQRLEHLVDVVVEGGNCGYEPTTILDLTESAPRLIRQGKGDVSWLMEDAIAPELRGGQ